MCLFLLGRAFEGGCIMIKMPAQYCDSCGLPINPEAGENCPRCGYPVSPPTEEHFLEAAIRDLQRVATYGGANLTVAGLIYYYQSRLKYLQDIRTKVATAPVDSPVSSVEEKPVKVSAINPFATPGQQQAAMVPVPPASSRPPATYSVQQPNQSVPHSMFSWRSFFADQAIN